MTGVSPSRLDANCAFTAHKHLVLAIWRHHTTAPAVEALLDQLRTVAAANPSGILLLQVVEATGLLPDVQTRDVMVSMLKSAGAFVKGSAVVHEGDGFKAAAVRSVTTSISLQASPTFPHRVFAAVDEAARWLASVSPVDLPGQDIIEACKSLRTCLDTQKA